MNIHGRFAFEGRRHNQGRCRPYLATNSKRVFTSLVAGLRLEITEALKEASLSMVITQHFSSFLRTHKSFSPFQCQGKIFEVLKRDLNRIALFSVSAQKLFNFNCFMASFLYAGPSAARK